MLFLQFIRPEYCRCVTRLFVDHSSLSESSLDISIVEFNLNEDLIFFLHKLLHQWLVTFNYNKTQVLLPSTHFNFYKDRARVLQRMGP